MNRSFALITTLLLLTLLMTVSVRLTTTVSTEVVTVARRSNDPAHELALDSAMLVLADRIAEPRGNRLIAELDRVGEAVLDFPIENVQVHCVVRDDGAKFSPLRFQAPSDRTLLERKLAFLAARLQLPDVDWKLQPILDERNTGHSALFRWFDQLFADVKPGDLFRLDETASDTMANPCWSDVLSLWGDGRVDMRRVSPEVLEAALEDVRPGLAKLMLSRRKPTPATNLLEQALVAVDAEIRQEVASRLAYDVGRYAVTIKTSIGADRRLWYVVMTINNQQTIVHHRSQLLW